MYTPSLNSKASLILLRYAREHSTSKWRDIISGITFTLLPADAEGAESILVDNLIGPNFSSMHGSPWAVACVRT